MLLAQHNHADIIELLADAIIKMKEIEDESSKEIKQSASDGLWNNPLSLLGTIPQDRPVTKPHSHLSSLRRRANTDPPRFQFEHKLPKISLSEHNVKKHTSLPRYFPSLNLNNSQEKNNYETPIHVAARQGSVCVVKALFDSGCCDTSARDSLGQTALHIAVLANRRDVIEFFTTDLNIEQFQVSYTQFALHLP